MSKGPVQPLLHLLSPLVGVALVLAVAGCESAEDKAAEHSLKRAADTSTCRVDANAVNTPYPGFPDSFPFPPRTTVYDLEDRGESGVVATAVTSTAFPRVLAFMNHDVVAAGFAVTSGETEQHDAEANWSSGARHGRWAIRASSSCPGETVIQVLAGAA